MTGLLVGKMFLSVQYLYFKVLYLIFANFIHVDNICWSELVLILLLLPLDFFFFPRQFLLAPMSFLWHAEITLGCWHVHWFVYWAVDNLPVATPLTANGYPSSNSNFSQLEIGPRALLPSISVSLILNQRPQLLWVHNAIAVACPEEPFTALLHILQLHILSARSHKRSLGSREGSVI